MYSLVTLVNNTVLLREYILKFLSQEKFPLTVYVDRY